MYSSFCDIPLKLYYIVGFFSLIYKVKYRKYNIVEKTMKPKFRFLKIFIIFLFATPVFAQSTEAIELDDNNGEVMSLFEIERLIRRTDYTEALKQLNIYIEKKPDYFDNAQRLVKIIMNRRKQYSVLAEKAIKSSEENPEDHETPVKIILQMRGIEKNPPS